MNSSANVTLSSRPKVGCLGQCLDHIFFHLELLVWRKWHNLRTTWAVSHYFYSSQKTRVAFWPICIKSVELGILLREQPKRSKYCNRVIILIETMPFLFISIKCSDSTIHKVYQLEGSVTDHAPFTHKVGGTSVLYLWRGILICTASLPPFVAI